MVLRDVCAKSCHVEVVEMFDGRSEWARLTGAVARRCRRRISTDTNLSPKVERGFHATAID